MPRSVTWWHPIMFRCFSFRQNFAISISTLSVTLPVCANESTDKLINLWKNMTKHFSSIDMQCDKSKSSNLLWCNVNAFIAPTVIQIHLAIFNIFKLEQFMIAGWRADAVMPEHSFRFNDSNRSLLVNIGNNSSLVNQSHLAKFNSVSEKHVFASTLNAMCIFLELFRCNLIDFILPNIWSANIFASLEVARKLNNSLMVNKGSMCDTTISSQGKSNRQQQYNSSSILWSSSFLFYLSTHTNYTDYKIINVELISVYDYIQNICKIK